jgi:hypothetical protein
MNLKQCVAESRGWLLSRFFLEGTKSSEFALGKKSDQMISPN